MPAEPLNPARLSVASPWGVRVQVIDEISSSNDELLRQGEQGAPYGTLLFAESQTAGRGQFLRPWNSAHGLGLWFSLLLRMEISDATIPSLSAFAAVALVNAIREVGIEGAGIKAPNDILLGGRKVAGILVETRVGKNPFAVVGIGLNVNHGSPDFPEDLKDQAISLAMTSKNPFNRNEVAAILLRHLGDQERLMCESREELLSSWDQYLISS